MNKIISIRKASLTNLDGITRSIHRLILFGFCILTWRTAHKSRASDWQASTLLGKVFGSVIIAILLFIGVLLTSIPARAQTNAPPPTPQGFLTSAESYFLTFNTNPLTFTTNDTVDIWTGMEYVAGANTAAALGISYNAFHLSTLTIGLESVTRNAGINGIILSQAGGLNLQLVHADTKVVGYVDAGYDFNESKPCVEIGTRIFKALTDNTFAGVGIGERFGGSKISRFPTVSVFAGFKL